MTKSNKSLSLWQSFFRVALSVVVAVSLSLGLVAVSSSVNYGDDDGGQAVYAASEKVYTSGIYKVTINYANVNGERKPESVNIVGAEPFKENIVVPAKLKVELKTKVKVKVKVKKKGKKTKTKIVTKTKLKAYKLPVVSLEKLDEKSDVALVDISEARYLKKVVFDNMVNPLLYDGFLLKSRDFDRSELDPGEIHLTCDYNFYKKDGAAVIPAMIFGAKVVFVNKFGLATVIDISNTIYVRRIWTEVYCMGYILTPTGRSVTDEFGKDHVTVKIIGTYAPVADPQPEWIYGLKVEN